MTLVGLTAKNLLRNKVRTVLTVLGVAVAIVTFVLLRTVVAAWNGAADFAAKDRIFTRHKLSFVMSLPKRYYDDVRGAPGIRSATYATWFAGMDPNHDKEFFATIAVDTKTYFDVYDEILVPAADMQKWREDRSGAIVGDILAKKLGWTVGQRVTLDSGMYPTDPMRPWTFTIDGIYTTTAKSVDRSTFFLHWGYLNDALPPEMQNEIGWVVSRTTDARRTADTSSALDRLFSEREVQTLSQDERTFQTSFLATLSAILGAMDVVSIAIMGIMILVLGNTISMGVRERTSEYGVLRALGFLPSHIASFIFGEAVLIGAAGGGVGLAIAYPLVERGVGRWLEENMGSFFPYFRIDTKLAVGAVALAIGLGVAAAALPAFRASRLTVTDALRRVA